MFRSVILLFIFILIAAGSAFAAPQISIEQADYDFGEVFQGEQVEYNYRFHNAGDDILELGQVHSSCGCTAALLSSRRIAPGDSGELQAKFDSTRFQGRVKKTISLETNDPSQRQVVFNLSGQVRVEVQVNPERVNWGTVSGVQELESLVTISNLGSTSITLSAPQTTNPALGADLNSRELPPGGQVEMKVRGKFDEGMARLRGYVIVPTDFPKVPQIRVPVSARLAE